MAKIEEGIIKLASSICRTGGHPLDDSAVVNTVADLYEFNEALYEGMMVVVNADHSIYVLTDVTKVGEAAGWKKIGDASGEISGLQSAIDKLNGDENTEGSVKKIAKGYADTALSSAKSYTDGKVTVTGVDKDDKILSLSAAKNLSADVSLAYDSSAKKLFLYGKSKSPASAISTIDCASFVKDGMLEGSALYKATAATGKVTINTKEYSLTGLTANHTYIVLVWNTDAAKDAMAIDVTTLIDTYTAGNGLKLSNNQFSIDTGVVATAAAVTDLGSKKIQGTAIKDIATNGLTLNGSNVRISRLYIASGDSSVDGDDTIDVAVGKLQYQVNDLKLSTTTIDGQSGAILLKKADSSDVDGTVQFSSLTSKNKTITATVKGLDSAAYKKATDFATSAQGAKADTALQGAAGGDYISAEVGGTTGHTVLVSANTANLESDSDGLVTAQNARQYVSDLTNSAQEAAEKYAESLMTWAAWNA